MTDTRTEAEKLTEAIHTRRLIRCRRVTQTHVEGGDCPSCGL